jgi:MFS family permease
MPAIQSTSAEKAGAKLNPVLALLIGLVAALAVWGATANNYPVFTPPKPEGAQMGPPNGSPEETARLLEIERYNVLLYLALFGAAIAGTMALGEGAAQRCGRRVVVGLLAGVVLGAAFGALGAHLGYLANRSYVTAEVIKDLKETVTLQCAMLVPLGLGVGIALGVAAGRLSASVAGAIGGVVAGGLAAMLYPVILGFLAPQAHPESLVPIEIDLRLAWLATAAGLIALVATTASQLRLSRGK